MAWLATCRLAGWLDRWASWLYIKLQSTCALYRVHLKEECTCLLCHVCHTWNYNLFKVYIGETKRNLPTRLKEHRAHGRRGDFEKSAIVKHSHIKTTKSTGRQPNSSHPSTHGTPDASERPSRSSNTTLCHRTSAFSSATFGDQYYRLKDLLYPKSITHTRLKDRLYPKSTTLLPLCLLTTDSVQWAHTPLPQPLGS